MPIFTFSSPLWPCDSHNWGGAERDPGGPQRLAWFMAGQPRRRCDLLRFAEHPRCAGRSAEREHVRVARRQDPHLHLLPAFAFGTNAFVNRSFSGSFFLMTPLLWSQSCTAFHRAGCCLSSLGKNGSVAPNVLADSVGSAIAFALLYRLSASSGCSCTSANPRV